MCEYQCITSCSRSCLCPSVVSQWAEGQQSFCCDFDTRDHEPAQVRPKRLNQALCSFRDEQNWRNVFSVCAEFQRIEEQLSSHGDLNARDHMLPEVHKSLVQLERRQEAALYRARASAEERQSLEQQFGKLNKFFQRVENR